MVGVDKGMYLPLTALHVPERMYGLFANGMRADFQCYNTSLFRGYGSGESSRERIAMP